MTVLQEIANGEFDDKLDAIITVATNRKKALAQLQVSTLASGDEVRIKDCRPKYLVGKVARVISVNGNSVQVMMPEILGYPRFSNRPVGLKPEMVEKV